MPIDRIPGNAYSNDKARAHRAAREQLTFVVQNIQQLRTVDPQRRAENAARSFLMLLKNGEELTPGQLSYADGIYEQTMKALGLPSCSVHSDRKRRSLKYG